MTYLSTSPKFLMTLNVCNTNESVCFMEPVRPRCLPKMNRLCSPPPLMVPCCWPKMLVTSSPFWHDLQWNAPMKTALGKKEEKNESQRNYYRPVLLSSSRLMLHRCASYRLVVEQSHKAAVCCSGQYAVVMIAGVDASQARH